MQSSSCNTMLSNCQFEYFTKTKILSKNLSLSLSLFSLSLLAQVTTYLRVFRCKSLVLLLCTQDKNIVHSIKVAILLDPMVD